MASSIIKKYSEAVLLIGLILMAIGLPLGNFIISIGGFVLLGSGIIHSILSKNIRLFFSNKPALALTSLFVMYVLGCFYSLDSKEAIHELRIVVPFLFLPFVFATMPKLSDKKVYIVLHFFVLAVVTNSIISYYLKFQNAKDDYRNIIQFISHIRYALMLVMSIFILLYYSLKKSIVYQVISVLTIVWLLYFLTVFQSATGMVILIATLAFSALRLIYGSGGTVMKYGVAMALLSFIVFSIYYVDRSYHQYFEAEVVDRSTLDKYTADGEAYAVLDDLGTLENGHYIWKYYAPKETEITWDKISEIKHDDKDKRGHRVTGTLVRYMTSKGLRKDKQGVLQLTTEDIENIQQGQTNYLWENQNSIDRRLHQIFYEINRYRVGFDPSESPTVSRLLFWKTALRLIKKNPILGVGTGSIRQALHEEYNLIQSPLSEKARKLVHNQYLTMAVQFGVLGLMWFVAVLFLPLFNTGQSPYLGYIFLVIFMISCITEDTLNTQAGLSFFVFFYCFFFVRKDGDSDGHITVLSQ